MNVKPEDITLIRQWKEAGHLVPFNGSLQRDQGVILVSCPDGDQFIDLIQHQAQFNQRIHPLTKHGGACILSSYGLRAKHLLHRDALLIDVRDAVSMKEIQTVLLQVHYPCGWAHANGVTLEEQMNMLLQARETVSALFAYHNTQVFPPQAGAMAISAIATLHVDYGADHVQGDGKRRKEYLVKLPNW